MLDYISVQPASDKWGISKRRIQKHTKGYAKACGRQAERKQEKGVIISCIKLW